MKFCYTDRFLKSFGSAPRPIQRAFEKQVELLIQNFRHPSLRAKKYSEAEGKWQARVNQDWRYYFRIEGGTYILLDIMHHPK
jgi:hypothetical protein